MTNFALAIFNNPEATLITFLAVVGLIAMLRKPQPPKPPDEFEPVLFQKRPRG